MVVVMILFDLSRAALYSLTGCGNGACDPRIQDRHPLDPECTNRAKWHFWNLNSIHRLFELATMQIALTKAAQEDPCDPRPSCPSLPRRSLYPCVTISNRSNLLHKSLTLLPLQRQRAFRTTHYQATYVAPGTFHCLVGSSAK